MKTTEDKMLQNKEVIKKEMQELIRQMSESDKRIELAFLELKSIVDENGGITNSEFLNDA